MVGYFMSRIAPWQRAAFLAAALALLYPAAQLAGGMAINLAGLATAAMLLWRARR